MCSYCLVAHKSCTKNGIESNQRVISHIYSISFRIHSHKSCRRFRLQSRSCIGVSRASSFRRSRTFRQHILCKHSNRWACCMSCKTNDILQILHNIYFPIKQVLYCRTSTNSDYPSKSSMKNCKSCNYFLASKHRPCSPCKSSNHWTYCTSCKKYGR